MAGGRGASVHRPHGGGVAVGEDAAASTINDIT